MNEIKIYEYENWEELAKELPIPICREQKLSVGRWIELREGLKYSGAKRDIYLF